MPSRHRPAPTVREQWRPILTEPGYEASNLGRIRSLDRVVETARGPRLYRGRLRASKVNAQTGYRELTLRNGGPTLAVHGLVAEAWLGPRPPGTEVCHGPGGRRDNRPSNLRYDTHAENGLDVVREGRHWQVSKAVCPLGHRLNGPNLVAASAALGHRSCLACSRARPGRSRARRAGLPWTEGQYRAEAHRRYAEIMTAVT